MRSGGVRRGFRRLPGSTTGGAALELAVIFPILLLLLIGVIDYGRAFFTAIVVTNAARAGAEYGARDPAYSSDTAAMRIFAEADGQETGVQASARRYCECGAGVANASCNACPGGAAPDVYAEVTARKTVTMFLRYPGLPSSINISRKMSFRSQ
ncbi:MAG: TadE/TadG family type IV pilus assembly protein [Nitrospirota bacterium]